MRRALGVLLWGLAGWLGGHAGEFLWSATRPIEPIHAYGAKPWVLPWADGSGLTLRWSFPAQDDMGLYGWGYEDLPIEWRSPGQRT